MKTVEFKFDIGDEVTISDGHEGTVRELRQTENDIRYLVGISERYKKTVSIQCYVVPESELSAGQKTFQHERK